MKIEEAIKILDGIRWTDESFEAINMAIEALKHQMCIKEKCAYCPHCENCNIDDDSTSCSEKPNGSDLIRRQDAVNELDDLLGESWTEYETAWRDGVISAKTAIEAIPSAEKTGKWIFEPKDAIELMFTRPKCSLCGYESADGLNYCPNCGARMVGDTE